MTKQYPILDFFQLQKDIKSKPIKPIYLMFGEESYLQNIILEEFKSRLHKEGRSIHYETFYGENIDFERFSNTLRTLPLGAQKQCITLKQFDKIKNSYIKKIDFMFNSLSFTNENIFILIFSHSKKIPNHISLDRIKQFGVIASLQKPRTYQIKQWINLKCREYNKKITDEALYYLQKITDNDLGQMNREIEKLFCYLGQEESMIEKQDILESFYGAEAGNIFDLVDAIGERRTEVALRLIRKLGENDYHALQLLAMISRQMKLILQAKQCQGNQKKMKGVAHLPSFVIDKLIHQSQKYHLDELKSTFGYLLDAEMKLKTGYFEPVLILEQLVIKIAKMN